MTRKTSTGHVISASGAAWLDEHPAPVADLAWTGYLTERRDSHGRWTRGGEPQVTIMPNVGPFSPRVRHLYTVLPQVGKGQVETPEAGTQAVTHIVTLPSGEKVIDKQSGDKTDLDREELASYVAQAIGAPAPAIYRAGDNRILQEYVPAKTAARYFSDVMDKAHDDALAEGKSSMEAIGAEEDAEDKAREDVFNTPEASKIADLDYLISNEDRNETNWMVDSRGHPVAIDHGEAGFDGYPSDSVFTYQHHPMHMHRKEHNGYEEWVPTTDPAEIEANRKRGWELADQLHPVQAQFARVGRQDWFDNVITGPVAQLINPDDTRAAYWQILKHWQDKYGDPEPWMEKPRSLR